MSTSRGSLTLKNVKHSVKKFFSSKTLEPSVELATTARARKSLFTIFSKTPRIHVCGVLGIVGPLHELNSGWMVSDFAAWAFLISMMAGYSPKRTIWNTIHPISPLFPNGSVTFGDAGCTRLVLPLPFPSEDNDEPAMSANTFSGKCMIDLYIMAQQVQQGEKLILLLVGHGSPGDGVFRLHLTTKPNDIMGEDFITKAKLEMVLKDCQGEILIICNSCHSALLASERWSLFCAADSHEPADSLSQSGSGYFRGSAFTACAVAQAAHEHGLRVPLPREEPSPFTTPAQQVALPPFPPPHSFPTSLTVTSTVRPSEISFQVVLRPMCDVERYLTDNSINTSQMQGSQSTVTWTSVLPIEFSAAMVNRVGLKAESADYTTIFNAGVSGRPGPQGGAPPTLTSPSPPINPLLIRLASAMSSVRHAPRTHEAINAQICRELVEHVADPERNASPLQAHAMGEDSLMYVVWSMHVQSVAVQEIARELKWCAADGVIEPFLPFIRKITKWELKEMIRHGVRVDGLAVYLETHHFHGMRPSMDLNSMKWLSDRWVTAGRPVILPSEWDTVLKKAGVLTAEEVMC